MVTLEDGSIHTQRKTRTEGNQGSDQTFIVANFFFLMASLNSNVFKH